MTFLALARAISEDVFKRMVPLMRKPRYAKTTGRRSLEASLQHWASIFFRSVFWVRFGALWGVDFGVFFCKNGACFLEVFFDVFFGAL